MSWFLGLPLLGQLWLVYALLAVGLFGLAACVEYGQKPVDGAGGWFFFGAFMLSVWGLLISLGASALILVVGWLMRL